MTPLRLQAATLLVLAWTCALPSFAASNSRRMEALGAVDVDSGRSGTPRDRARFAAVRDAVRRMALELVPQDLRPDGTEKDPEAWIEAALGKDPYSYATSFRILQDRGTRPAILTPDAETEYVVLVEVILDEARIRERLSARGLLPENSAQDRSSLEIEVEVGSYPAYQRLRETLLDSRGVHSALPLEMSRGRVLLAVEADVAPEPLLTGLIRRTPPGLRVELLGIGDARARLRVDWVEPAANENDAGASP